MKLTNSIVYKFSAQLTVILVILFAVLLLSNVYSLEVVRNQSMNHSRNTLAIYVENIRNDLNLYAKDLTEVFENNVDTAADLAGAGESVRYFKSVQLMNALKSKMSSAESSDGMFIKLPGDDRPLAFFGNRIRGSGKLSLQDYLSKHDFKPDPDGKIDEWTDFEIGGTFYLFKYITYSNITFGTFVSADTLLSVVNREGDAASQFVLSDKDGIILAATGAAFGEGTSALEDLSRRYDRSYLLISEPIAEFGQITDMVAKQSIFSGLKLIQWIIISLGVLSVVIVPLVLRFLARDILRPVLELVKAAKEVEKGGWEFQIPPGRYSMEFTRLFHSFHSMVHEIKDLKIHTYEERIERSRAELKYLQMQIRPHFFLNAISTISSLTYQNKNEEIRRWIGHLSEHLRYLFRGGLVLVPVHEEMKHVENYIRMQEIRYPDRIFYMTDIDSEAGQAVIPQLLIQTFAENAFKHAMVYGETLSLFIRVSMDRAEDEPCVRIVVEDTGPGFPATWLSEDGFPPEESNENNGRVGIANIRRTLQLLYKRDGLLELSNAEPSGARVEIRVPIRTEAETTTRQEG
ncbi:sensor histidine kinase [Cohnella caldifontis]|uniref:sensor histidine kinase n=1 Tax=Cohnella caldifontis TaxID=3027471 RepID=UPI0023ED829B|nr:histidine kinase [Cohnella sp. YIM B05605]